MVSPASSTTRLRLFLWLAVALQSTAVSAAAALASATRSAIVPPDAQSPRPTDPPIMWELDRRQNSFTYLMAPDNTCGWLSGNTNTFWSCAGSTMRCAFWLSDGPMPNRQTCCPSQGCQSLHPLIVDLDSTGSVSPFCHTRFFGSSGDFQSFSCSNTSWATPRVYITTKGDEARRFATLATLAPVATTYSGAVSTKIVTVTSGSETSGGGEGGSDKEGGQPGGGEIGSSRNNNTTTGAIVVGAVGGAVVLAIAGLAGVLLHRRRSKSKADISGYAPPPQRYQSGSPGHGESTLGASVYAPPSGQFGHYSASAMSLSNGPLPEGGYPKQSTPLVEVDGTGTRRIHELG